MANTAPNLISSSIADPQGFWKPIAAHPNVEVSEPASAVSCSRCGGGLLAGASYCPGCGAESPPGGVEYSQSSTLVRRLLSSWRNRSMQTIASRLALVAGGFCFVVAAVTSFVFKATNLVDWQAVQLWRIEWLLAAIAILLAGILLKKN